MRVLPLRRLLSPVLLPVLAGVLALPVAAQEGNEYAAGTVIQPSAPMPILTLDQDRLFSDSAWGKAALARAEADSAALSAENRRIEQALQDEEEDLTQRRATVPAADFARLATEFDTRVEEIRAAQDAKSRAISRRLDEDRQRFFEAATPVLTSILADTGAAAILADSAIVISRSSLDITAEAIARMDAALPAVAPGAPAPADPPPSP